MKKLSNVSSTTYRTRRTGVIDAVIGCFRRQDISYHISDTSDGRADLDGDTLSRCGVDAERVMAMFSYIAPTNNHRKRTSQKLRVKDEGPRN